MQQLADKIDVPSDIGRIPCKISTGKGFSRFTADSGRLLSSYMLPLFVGICYVMLIGKFLLILSGLVAYWFVE